MHVVTLLGPPGSGKSTIAAALAARHGAEAFRLREFAHRQARADPAIATAMIGGSDPLGWLPDPIATLLVGRALTAYAAGGGTMIVLESYPGSSTQARALAALCDRTGWRLGALELTCARSIVLQRIDRRRICASCDPHRRKPARANPQEPQRCAACGGDLERRTNDHPAVAARRLARYQHHAPQIRAALRTLGVPWHTVDASRPRDQVRGAAVTAFQSLTTSSSQLAPEGNLA